jgi:2-polyprenyl-6-methoxyphenol hydroxylase-like FAD-dependent oxidoreductase
MDQWKTTCLVAGGGPAGMMLGYLLARSGVQTLLVEKHGDFSATSAGARAARSRSVPT